MGWAPHLTAALSFNLHTLPDQLLNGIFLGAIYALIALGYTMVYGILRLINFAHGDVYMLGAYASLFVSRMLGFGPMSTKSNSGTLDLLLMITASMIVCACVGVIIERFAYRPMRSYSRIASLITAIGVSLLLEYGGALFLPSSPPSSINQNINPYHDTTYHVQMVPPPKDVADRIAVVEPAYVAAKKAYDEWTAKNPGHGEFDLPPDGLTLKNKMLDSQEPYFKAQSEAQAKGWSLTIRLGDLIIFGTSILLMVILTYLVMFTKAGRAMRAVSHDFDSAALMGVNVNRTVTFTFTLGSALAGAGAMMQATFKASAITTFFGFVPGVKAFVAAVLGGIGNIPGAVLGGLLMGLAEDIVIWMGYSNYSDAVAFVILIVVLLFRPGGLLGSSKVEKV